MDEIQKENKLKPGRRLCLVKFTKNIDTKPVRRTANATVHGGFPPAAEVFLFYCKHLFACEAWAPK